MKEIGAAVEAAAAREARGVNEAEAKTAAAARGVNEAEEEAEARGVNGAEAEVAPEARGVKETGAAAAAVDTVEAEEEAAARRGVATAAIDWAMEAAAGMATADSSSSSASASASACPPWHGVRMESNSGTCIIDMRCFCACCCLLRGVAVSGGRRCDEDEEDEDEENKRDDVGVAGAAAIGCEAADVDSAESAAANENECDAIEARRGVRAPFEAAAVDAERLDGPVQGASRMRTGDGSVTENQRAD